MTYLTDAVESMLNEQRRIMIMGFGEIGYFDDPADDETTIPSDRGDTSDEENER
jgi:hypothetical protein